MKNIFLLVAGLLFSTLLSAQRIGKIIFTASGQVECIEMELPEDVVLQVSKDGQIIKWGVNRYAGYTNMIQEKLDPYVGRVDKYSDLDNEAFRGKVRSIGTIPITYYASYDNDAYKGKIRSIGTLAFDYFLLQENEAFKGNIKKIGSSDVTWYSSFDQEDLRGKLKSIGYTNISYYTAMDDKIIKGKVKDIGGNTYQYYTSFDRKELQGLLKQGNYMRSINGIKFLLRN